MTDFLDALERQLVSAAARAGGPARMSVPTVDPPTVDPLAARSGDRPRPMRGRWLVLLAPALLVLVAAGLALGGVIEVGQPANPESAPSAARFGALVAGSSRLEPVSVPDPAGGLPWGMRVFSTRAGVGCLQVGRLLDGRLGALGEDGAFGDDGRFHEILPGTAVRFFECSALDGDGRVFNNVTLDNLPMSGWNGFGACAPATATAAEKAPELGQAVAICPEADERDLHFGLLGPEAQSVTYSSEGKTRTLRTSGPEGAYLIVERPSPNQLLSGKGLGTGNVVPTDGPITEVHYRNGETCHLTSKIWINAGDACTPSLQMPVGYKPVKTPTQAEVTSPVSARTSTGRRGEAQILVSFTSRVSLTEYRSSYSLQLEEPMLHAVAAQRYGRVQDVKAGETITIPIQADKPGGSLPPGLYRGTVILIAAKGSALFEGPETAFLTVGSFSVRVP